MSLVIEVLIACASVTELLLFLKTKSQDTRALKPSAWKTRRIRQLFHPLSTCSYTRTQARECTRGRLSGALFDNKSKKYQIHRCRPRSTIYNIILYTVHNNLTVLATLYYYIYHNIICAWKRCAPSSLGVSLLSLLLLLLLSLSRLLLSRTAQYYDNNASGRNRFSC